MDVQEQIKMITSPQISNVIGEGLALIYNEKPDFPVTYLANWLNSYSASQKRKQQLISSKSIKQQRFNHIQSLKAQHKQSERQQKQQLQKQKQLKDKQFQQKITQTKHLQDLFFEWLPEFIQKEYDMAGVYVGKLDFNKKNIEQGNFQLGAQNDTQNPKVISYIGASNSHKNLMLGAFLPQGKGVTYDIFEQKPQEENQEGNEQAEIPQKKSYLYINNVLKSERPHYFKYPKLGSYVCYPIKIKSCLNIASLDKAILDYKAYLKTKEQNEKQYNQKVTEAKTETQQALKKVEDFQLNEEDPTAHEKKAALQNDAKAAQQKLQQLLKNPPVIDEVKFDTVQRSFFLAADRLGQDKQISQSTLKAIDKKVKLFIKSWQQKEHKMILNDILTFLEEEFQLQNVENILQEQQKNLISTYQAQIKQQFAKKEKQAEFEMSLIKCEKTRQLLSEPQFKASMDVYLNYNVPKFTDLIQILCMLLGLSKKDINIAQSNQLDHRKIINTASFNKLFQSLEKYELRRQSSQTTSSEYKINKLLQRLQKIDAQALSKYNGFLFVLHYLLKTYCWTRILCRDAKKELFETKTRQKQDRENQIQKWLTDAEKNLQTTKAQLDEQGQQNFKEDEWRKTYEAQNPKPQPLEAPELKEFLDIE